MEYINTFMAEEDTHLLIGDKDINGEPFFLKKVVMIITVEPAVSSTSNVSTLYGCLTANPLLDLNLNYEDAKVYLIAQGMSQTERKISACVAIIDLIDNENGMVVFHGGISLARCHEIGINTITKGFCKVGIYNTLTTGFIGAGSTVKVYGVRA